jgi:hypothetical protein
MPGTIGRYQVEVNCQAPRALQWHLAFSFLRIYCAQALFAVFHAVQLPLDSKQAPKSRSSAVCEHAPCSVGMGEYSASGFNAPTSLGMQAASVEDPVDPLSAPWLLVAGWDALQPAPPTTTASTLIVTTTSIAALRSRFMSTVSLTPGGHRSLADLFPGRLPQRIPRFRAPNVTPRSPPKETRIHVRPSR